MLEFLGIAAGLLAAASYIPYAYDIVAKKVRPERASWIIWLVLALIAFTTQLAEGASASLWFTGLDSLGVIIILVLSAKYGTGGLSRRDYAALVAAAIGLVLWYLTRHAAIALGITLIIDAIGTSLTVVKTFEDPSSETYPMWTIVTIAGLMATVSVGQLNPVLLAYPVYILLANFAVVVAIFLGRRKSN
jgi:hypothetical protein